MSFIGQDQIPIVEDYRQIGGIPSVNISQNPKVVCQTKTVAALPAYTATGAGQDKKLTGNANGTIGMIDGYVPLLGDRILVDSLGSTTDVDNGIYTLIQLGSATTPWVLERSTDADQNYEIVSGLAVYITQGATTAGFGYTVLTPNPIIIDTTAVTFTNTSAPPSPTPTWAQVLAMGNVSGGTNPVITSGDQITGQDLATGGDLPLRGGNSSGAAATGGDVTLTGGTGGAGGNGGAVTITGGATPTTATGGAVVITGGTGGTTGNAGDVTVQGGTGGSTVGGAGPAGDLNLLAGSAGSLNNAGGNVIITAGTGAGTGAGGDVTITSGLSSTGGTGDITLMVQSPGTSGPAGALNLIGAGTNTGAGAFNFTTSNAGSTGAGGTFNITSGAGGSTSGNGGTINITSGDSPNGNGGTINIISGDNTIGPGLGGPINITTGTTSFGAGGILTITTGVGAGPGAGGHINVNVGDGGVSNGTGGHYAVTAGDGGGGLGTGGFVSFTTGVGGTSGNGGAMTFTTGASGGVAGNGGNISFSAGTGTTNGGNITLTPGTSAGTAGVVSIVGAMNMPSGAANTTLQLFKVTGTVGTPTSVPAGGATAYNEASGALYYYDAVSVLWRSLAVSNAPTAESFSVAGGANHNPDMSVATSFVTTTGAGNATGTMANGTVVGQIKYILMSAGHTSNYVLTITGSIIDAAGTLFTTATFTTAGQSMAAMWDGTNWINTNAGVALS